MSNDQNIKELVKKKYNEIALQDKTVNQASCCGSGPASTEIYNIMSENYASLNGYNTEADLGLGCGLPTQFAKITPGQIVIDLGSGAGNDCFIARAETGPTGRVIGIDFSQNMLEKARHNAKKLDFENVEFLQGDIENIPVKNNIADVVISNCALNLVPNKENVFKEIYRVLKPGGHFSISDVVLVGTLPDSLKKAAEMYVGCVSGAIQKGEYLRIINEIGFKNITIQKEKEIIIPDDILDSYLQPGEMKEHKEKDIKIMSITIFANRPDEAC